MVFWIRGFMASTMFPITMKKSRSFSIMVSINDFSIPLRELISVMIEIAPKYSPVDLNIGLVETRTHTLVWSLFNSSSS